MVCVNTSLLPSNVAFEFAVVQCFCSGIETIDKHDAVDRAKADDEQDVRSEPDPSKAVGRSPPN